MKTTNSNSSKYLLTNKILKYLNKQNHIYHLLFEIIVIVLLVSVIDSIVIPNKNIFYLLSLLIIVSIIVDYYLWNNMYQTLLFGFVVIGYLYYSNQQKNFLKSFYHRATLKKLLKNKNVVVEEEDNWSTLTNYSNNENNSDSLRNNFNDIKMKKKNNKFNKDNKFDEKYKLDGIYHKSIPNPNVLDFKPDDINKQARIIPYMKGIKEPNIDTELGGLPSVDYSDTPIGKINNDILVALDDRHTIPLMQDEEVNSNENIFRDGKYRNAIGSNLETLPKNVKIRKQNWNLDRYYPKCKTINDEKTDDLKVSNKMIHYCTNLPEVKDDQYEMISGNNVELIEPAVPHIQIFPKQFDIGGQGIVHRDFNSN